MHRDGGDQGHAVHAMLLPTDTLRLIISRCNRLIRIQSESDSKAE